MSKSAINRLYYITHIDNIPSIMKHGILSHKLVETQGVTYTPIYDTTIVTHRGLKTTPDGQSLWNFANLYFQPRNPMLYRVKEEKGIKNIAILGIRRDVLNTEGAFVTDGNAASAPSHIFPIKEGLKEVRKMRRILNQEYWNPHDSSKRQIMAECLLPNAVPPQFIDTIYVANHQIAESVRTRLQSTQLSIVPEPYMFFQPTRRERITDRLSLVAGDMFFSQMQTLTISVNTVGVMGKGLASRAKYQFPDVYVHYQDLCRRKILKMGQPAIYKRESFIDSELASDSATLSEPNSNKWFLLFPTKAHWRQQSDIQGIEAGLVWVQHHYKREGIQSLAVPALGCGLGKLDWRDVGPLMCRYLARLDIQATIYLPREQELPDELLSPAFLLREPSH